MLGSPGWALLWPVPCALAPRTPMAVKKGRVGLAQNQIHEKWPRSPGSSWEKVRGCREGKGAGFTRS